MSFWGKRVQCSTRLSRAFDTASRKTPYLRQFCEFLHKIWREHSWNVLSENVKKKDQFFRFFTVVSPVKVGFHWGNARQHVARDVCDNDCLCCMRKKDATMLRLPVAKKLPQRNPTIKHIAERTRKRMFVIVEYDVSSSKQQEFNLRECCKQDLGADSSFLSLAHNSTRHLFHHPRNWKFQVNFGPLPIELFS